MKEEAKPTGSWPRPSRPTTACILAALEKTERGQKFLTERVRPYTRVRLGAVWVHEFTFPTQFEDPGPFLETVKGYIETNYDYPTHVKELARTSRRPARNWLPG